MPSMRPVKSVGEIKAALADPERGHERYDDFHGLWHLAAMEVIDVAEEPATGGWKVTEVIWSDPRLAAKAARIALIDTGVADHPNLRNRILWDEAIDFGTRDAGAVYSRDGVAQKGPAPAIEAVATLAGLGSKQALKATIARLNLPNDVEGSLTAEMSDRLSHGVRKRTISVQDQRYPSHGTTSAGLAVGAPLILNGKLAPGTLPFFGVDPISQIIPIATSPEPEPIQLTLALIYALANDADVILMPRGADNPARAPRPDPRVRKFNTTRYDELAKGWELFEAVLIAVSKCIPVICAAGNSADCALEYPASLAAPDNGIVAVGAVTAAGRRSGYGCYGPGITDGGAYDDSVTLAAPSNDFRVYTRHQIRIDPQAAEAIDHNWLIHELPGDAYVEYANEAPFSIDIPGPRGYRAGSQIRPGGEADLESLYTLFGGTSAASCEVAGIVALMRRSATAFEAEGGVLDSGAGWSGTFVKKALAASGAATIFGNPLKPDRANPADEALSPAALARQQFGAGVVSAKLAIEAIRNA